MTRMHRTIFPHFVMLVAFSLVWLVINLHATYGAPSSSSCIENAVSQIDSSGIDLLTLSIHRNGEFTPCAHLPFQRDIFQKAMEKIVTKGCPKNRVDKYQMESIFTAYLREQFSSQSNNNCGSTDNATAPEGIEGFCDMGPLRTTVQPDTNRLIRQPDTGSLPCRFYTREGRRISSVDDFIELSKLAINSNNEGGGQNCDDEDTQTCSSSSGLQLYAVPAGRVFMFAPSYVGERFVLDHVEGATQDHLILEVINLEPRVFEIYDFFSPDEARHLIEKTLAETDEEFGLHRSRTGATSKSIFNKRTSENAWDTNGEVALDIKGRCMEMLGFDEYWSAHTDGLQILRYRNAQAYTPHQDYLKIKDNSKKDPYDYDTRGLGGNRFATILLYMTDLGEADGGETIFEKAAKPGWETMPSQTQALELLRRSDDPNLSILQPDSWEEEMTALCRSRLSIRPHTGRAVLFYSQFPNGEQDFSSLHGGCPVLNGTKWAANLWVWNAPRTGNRLAPRKKGFGEPPGPDVDLYVTFQNEKNDPAYANAHIWYKDKTNFGSLGHGESFRAKTYRGHVWKIKTADGKTTLFTHTIMGKEEEEIVTV